MTRRAVTLTAPFPWFGGKSRAADIVWEALGDVDLYIEPFAGSLAVLLARPLPAGETRREIVNDLDGMIANFWRSMALEPDAVVDAADWPVIQVDLRARWDALDARRAEMVERLRADPRWCDPEAAGWWVWGQSASIGGNWLSGADARPHLGRGGGVHCGNGLARLREVAARLRHVRVVCGDWSAVLTDGVLAHGPTVGVFLDPPYGEGRADGCYAEDDKGVYAQVTAWASSAPPLRVVVAGYDGEHDALERLGWTRRAWRPHGGMSRAERGVRNRGREVLWCSPSCYPARSPALFGAA